MPKGTSEYQSAWIMDEETESQYEGNDHEEVEA